MPGVKSVPLEFGIEGKRRWLIIKDALELDTVAIEGGDKSRDSVVSNVPFSVVPGADMTVARSSKYNYNDHGNGITLVKIASIVDLSIVYNKSSIII
jgi:hypothetical protein